MRWLMLGMLLCSLGTAASFPRLYSEVGNPLFNAAEGYALLLRQAVAEEASPRYRDFIARTEVLRKEGLRLDGYSGVQERKRYIADLRALDREMDELKALTQQKLLALKAAGAYARLARLQNNPYPFLREHPAVREAVVSLAQQNGRVVMYELDTVEQLHVSLENIKARLMAARAADEPEALCLNDMTAINYWMLEARLAKAGSDPCGGLRACRQIEAFVLSAARHCQDEMPWYVMLRESASVYTTSMKQEFYETCR